MSALHSTRLRPLQVSILVFFVLALAWPTPALPLDCFWKPVDGNWNDPSNWDCGVVPDTDDTAFLHSGGTVNVTVAASVSGMSMTTNVLNGNAVLTVTSSMNWSGGTIAGTGKLIIDDTASLLIVAGGASKKFLTGTIENFGQTTVSDGLGGGGQFVNRQTGTLDFAGDLSFDNTVTNEGMLIKSSGSGSTSFGFGANSQAATGSTDVQSGTLRFFNTTSTFDGTITATGTSLLIAGGTFNFDGAEIDVSNITVSGANADFSGADSVTIGNFLHAGGDVSFDLPLVTIKGNFTRTATGSTFDAGNGKIVFDGEQIQNLDVSRPTEFYFVEVTEGTRLVETVEVDNASVTWFLWNRGVIEKTKSVPVSGSVSFGLTGVELEVTDPGTFTSLQVERVGSNHSSADPTTRLGEHWLFTPTGGGFDVDLTLDHCYQPEGDVRLCRYTGASWDCGVDSVSLTEITRTGVTDLSTWTLGLTDPRTLKTGFECGNPSAWSFLVHSP